jgi:hypothetical protein
LKSQGLLILREIFRISQGRKLLVVVILVREFLPVPSLSIVSKLLLLFPIENVAIEFGWFLQHLSAEKLLNLEATFVKLSGHEWESLFYQRVHDQ